MAKSFDFGFGKIDYVNQTHIYFKQMSPQNEEIDSFVLIKTQNIGILEPVPIGAKNQDNTHEKYLIIFLVISLLLLLGLIIWYFRKRILGFKSKSLINYEMQNL